MDEEAVTKTTPTYPRTTRRIRFRQRGFTLLELVFVMVVMAIAAAVVLPSVGAGRRQREVRTTLQHFVSAVREASSRSVFERRRVELRVWPDDGEYGLVKPKKKSYGPDGELEFVDDRAGIADDAETDDVKRVKLPEHASFGEIVGGRRTDLEELGTISFDFFPTGSSSGGDIELVFEDDRSRQSYMLKINPLISSITMEDGS